MEFLRSDIRLDEARAALKKEAQEHHGRGMREDENEHWFFNKNNPSYFRTLEQ